MPGRVQGALHEEPSAVIPRARDREGRGQRCYGNSYSGTQPETVETCQGEAYRRARPLLLGVLAMPPNEALSLERLAVVNPEIARQYATESSRTLQRDLKVAQDMSLVVEHEPGKCLPNLGLLVGRTCLSGGNNRQPLKSSCIRGDG